MLAKVYSYGISGLDAYPVTIEVDVSPAFRQPSLSGLPDNAVKESKERVRAAIKNSGYQYKPHHYGQHPRPILKEGPSFDLAIALGVLATEQINVTLLQKYIVLGNSPRRAYQFDRRNPFEYPGHQPQPIRRADSAKEGNAADRRH